MILREGKVEIGNSPLEKQNEKSLLSTGDQRVIRSGKRRGSG
jgi:hypothetical protein